MNQKSQVTNSEAHARRNRLRTGRKGDIEMDKTLIKRNIQILERPRIDRKV